MHATLIELCLPPNYVTFSVIIFTQELFSVVLTDNSTQIFLNKLCLHRSEGDELDLLIIIEINMELLPESVYACPSVCLSVVRFH